ncbi:MAG: SAM-dependent chlorinase/fluorinase [Cyanobacteria bacterium J06632_22]
MNLGIADMSLITLMTDFGTCDGYVGVMKGVIAQLGAGVRVVDVTHDIPPQDVMAARFVVMNSYPYFPARTVHCVVVDPGVGTDRRGIALEAAVDGQRQFFVAPDNGVLDSLRGQVKRSVALTNPEYWRVRRPSRTFHGRDIFAPVAAHLATGVDLSRLGEVVTVDSLVRLPMEDAIATPQGFQGVIQYIDRFGNAITTIPGRCVTGRPWQLLVGERSVLPYSSYGDAQLGELLGLIGSHGWVEIAVNQGSAAERLRLRNGDRVTLVWRRGSC